MYWFMLDDAQGHMEGDTLVVVCGDDLTLESLNCPEVSQVLKDVTGERLGRTVNVRYTMGKGVEIPAAQEEDKLDTLIQLGQKFDSFTVK